MWVVGCCGWVCSQFFVLFFRVICLVSTKAAALAAKYPNMITVCDSNQSVLDSCDVVMLAVRPQVATSILDELTFSARHTVISLMAVINFKDLRTHTSPATQIFRCCPLPPAARGEGAIILCAPTHSDMVTGLLSMAGKVVEVTTEKDLASLQSVTCLMGPFYNMLQTCQNWLTTQGIDGVAASQYCGAMFQAVANDAEIKSNSATGFAELVAEQTPQGVNEAAIEGLERRGVYTAYEQVLNLTHGRLTGVVSLDASEEEKL
eukprot:m.104969 g.104969  ORF g.104969 m.104969 type:complete len:262 (+) comp27607_c0_seq6:129-914(+)